MLFHLKMLKKFEWISVESSIRTYKYYSAIILWFIFTLFPPKICYGISITENNLTNQNGWCHRKILIMQVKKIELVTATKIKTNEMAHISCVYMCYLLYFYCFIIAFLWGLFFEMKQRAKKCYFDISCIKYLILGEIWCVDDIHFFNPLGRGQGWSEIWLDQPQYYVRILNSLGSPYCLKP